MRPDRSTTRERYPEAFPDQYPERPEVPLLSVSASTPLSGEPQQPLQYFVPTHKPAPPSGTIVPPPTGLNLSSYSFLLMEKRDREREAMERANRGYLADALSDKKDSHRDDGYNYSPPMQSSEIPAYSGHPGSPHTHPSDRSYLPGSYDDYPRSHPSDRDTRYSHPHHGPYPYPPTHYGHSEPYPPAGHHYHSSSSANIGDPYSHHRPAQEYTDHHHSPQTQSQFQFSSHRAMSPSLLDKPRFANGNLSVFRQSAADDSDGNASVSSSGSHKRRRRPKQTGGEKKLPGSALSTAHQLTRRNSQGSDFGIPDYYDGDSSDENLDVRTGLQGLNLQKSAKTAVAAAKKLRTKTERPFKIGELVESIKSDTNGTWFAGRVVDLEDDPHDHINPKSVLIHFEGFAPVHDEWIKPGQIRACSTGSSFLRHGPSGAELPETWISYKKFYHSELGRIARRHTGVAYDRRMLLHKCQCNTNPEERHHPEQPERLLEILCQFQKNGMLSLVKWIQGREATIEELVAAHTETHVRNYCCTETENRTYAREHGLPFGSEDEDEEEEEEEDEEDDEVKEHAKEPTKPTQGRGRPKRGARGSILVAATSTDAPSQGDGALKSPTIPGQTEDVEMTTSQDKEGMEVDLHSPALGRRRSSMRGSVIRMSSLVSMSSTLYAQREEDMALEDKALIADDDDDDDDKMGQVGPAPSEAAAAVAGGMDPAVASQLTSSPKTVPKTVEPKDLKDAEMVKSEALEEDKNIPPLDLAKSEQDTKPEPKIENTSSTSLSGSTSSRRESGISKANVIEGQRRSSRSFQGQSGATAVIVPLPKTKEVNEEDDEPEPAVTGKEKKDKKDKEKEKEKEKDKAIVAKTKEHEVVSPAPLPTDDSRIIRPPGLTFTMTCGQLGIAVDTTWNPVHSSTAARVAAGCLITLVDQVVTGRCKNGFAIIRPPGHHAEEDEAMGFCFFNNVGVAVNLTLSRYPLTVQKILIIDWDVHHGNGTQQIFYENPNVLYISLHRWDNGHFYPFTGAPDECGEEAGEGKNVNIAWSSYGRGQAMGDVEYIAAFWYVLLPIARQFQPDLVFVSAGFDAADGHAANIGGYTVSPQGFAILTRLVQTLAGGRVILSLEGGYEFEPLANSATACLEELLPHSLLPATAPTRAFPFASFSGTLNSVKPNAMAVSSLHQVLKYQQKYWKFPPEVLNPSFRFQLPAEWKASNSLATRPRRERNPRRKAPALDS
ncbi:Histone deacetylase [Podila minutissima]|uniref:histone deacetylase n=1 Tax=Podila minutissima TaxID=64525 RepID=A0A9P5SSI3_9FUNG|nr:Histone deacetylase [Podila minutissima]